MQQLTHRPASMEQFLTLTGNVEDSRDCRRKRTMRHRDLVGINLTIKGTGKHIYVQVLLRLWVPNPVMILVQLTLNYHLKF